MAIQVGGTTVVNDSRQLQNIASLDATTEATISAVAGVSTTFGDVGTHIIGRPQNSTNYNTNDTASSLKSVERTNQNYYPYWNVSQSAWFYAGTINSMSGTWRCLEGGDTGTGFFKLPTLWVRIS